MDFCLIHLSDFHLRSKTLLTTDGILQSLVTDASERIRELDLPDPYIALSGDLAFGGREDEYSLVDSFLGTLGEKLHSRKTIFCPGNHDVNWSLLSPLNSNLMNLMIEKGEGSLETAEASFASETERETLMSGMSPYYSFLKSHGVRVSNMAYYIESAEVANLKLNFISLNSAYLFSAKYYYEGYVGRQQIESAAAKVDQMGQPAFNITLVHHPLEAIAPPSQEETKKLLLQLSDIILNGHVHSPRVSLEYTANMIGRTKQGPPPVVSCARCVFSGDNNPAVIPGYSIFGIDFEYEGVASLKVWEVQFDKGKGEWYHDERKRTYPLVVKVPSARESAGTDVLGSSDQVGQKVTDAEKRLLSRWKRSNRD
jgi:predicted MPP superfamily phosphohydrolase